MDAIDYERGRRADVYRQARTLPPAALAAWETAVAERGIPDGGPVLDVGPGTGQFLVPLARWLGAPVVGVEPSPAMRAEAATPGLPTGVTVVAGRAEALPLAAGGVSVAWLSTVVHQLADLAVACRELRRATVAGGHVLVRGFFGNRALSGPFAHIPGAERVAATFPTTTAIVAAFEAAGFGDAAVTPVTEDWPFEPQAWVARARTMRHTDSALRQYTDDELEAGFTTLLETTPPPTTNSVQLDLLHLRA